MARFIYSWKQTEHGRRLFRRPRVGAPVAAETATAEPAPTVSTDLGSLKKDELVALADERGVDSSGTKADIIERLEP